ARYLQTATHVFGETTRNRKSQPGATVPPGHGGFRLGERLKDTILVNRCDANSSIRDRNHQLSLTWLPSRSIPLHLHPDASFRGEFDFILQKIANDLPDGHDVKTERSGYGFVDVEVEE